MAGRWVYGQEVEQGVVCFRPVTKNWERAAGLVLWRQRPGVEASGLHHSNGMGALDFATSHLTSHTAVHLLTQFASNEASHVFLMSQSKSLVWEDTVSPNGSFMTESMEGSCRCLAQAVHPPIAPHVR